MQSQTELSSLKRRYEQSEKSLHFQIQDLSLQLKQRSQESFTELKSTFNRENQALRQQNSHFQSKIRQLTQRCEDLARRNQFLEYELQGPRQSEDQHGQLQQAILDKEAADIEREKASIALKQCKLDAALAAQRWKETEFTLKEQIKSLLNKEYSFHSRTRGGFNISAISSTESSLVNLCLLYTSPSPRDS